MSFATKLVGAVRFPGVARSFSRGGFRRRATRFDPADLAVSMRGKQCLVTGANAGIGLAISRELAARDADVWMLCRSAGRGEAAAAGLRGLGAGTVRVEVVDMSSMESVGALCGRLSAPGIDVLVHNAGALFDERVDTPEGIERTFALHVVGPQRLTAGLLDELRARPGSRVIYVSSGGMYSERLSVDDLIDPPEPFDGVRAYALAKRAQVVLAEMWAAAAPEVAFYAMHPGWADTEGVRTSLPGFYKLTRRWLRSPAEGADTAVWLAVAPSVPVPSGGFVFDRAETRRHMLPGTRAEPAERERLWAEVARRSHPSSNTN